MMLLKKKFGGNNPIKNPCFDLNQKYLKDLDSI